MTASHLKTVTNFSSVLYTKYTSYSGNSPTYIRYIGAWSIMYSSRGNHHEMSVLTHRPLVHKNSIQCVIYMGVSWTVEKCDIIASSPKAFHILRLLKPIVYVLLCSSNHKRDIILFNEGACISESLNMHNWDYRSVHYAVQSMKAYLDVKLLYIHVLWITVLIRKSLFCSWYVTLFPNCR